MLNEEKVHVRKDFFSETDFVLLSHFQFFQ